MRVRANAPLDETVKSRQIDRITASPILHGADSLCRLLRFLAKHAIEHSGVPLKEYQIATELLGRPADFDPRLDSSVRVQTGRLRAKLGEYYAGPGALDSVGIEIPKGAYTLTFARREPRQEARPASGSTLWRFALLAPLVVMAAWGLSAYWMSSAAGPNDSMRLFWKPFLSGDAPPLVVYSNAAFVGRPETGMRYYDASADAGRAIMDHYTGVGEVMAIHALDRVFASLGAQVRLKRARLLTWDEAKSSSLIFIGSTAENDSLREIPGTRAFLFAHQETGPRKGDLAIVNVRPRQGEPEVFFGSPGLPVVEDYALVSLLWAPDPERSLLILAGTTTLGTEAAAEFVCDPGSLERLARALGIHRRQMIPFEAVLRVRISGGVPVQSEVVALRARTAPGS